MKKELEVKANKVKGFKDNIVVRLNIDNLNFQWESEVYDELTLGDVECGHYTIDFAAYYGKFLLSFGGYFNDSNTYYTHLDEKEFLYTPKTMEELNDILVVYMIKFINDARDGLFFNNKYAPGVIPENMIVV